MERTGDAQQQGRDLADFPWGKKQEMDRNGGITQIYALFTMKNDGFCTSTGETWWSYATSQKW